MEKNPIWAVREVEAFDSAEQLRRELLKTAEMLVQYMQKQQEGFEAIGAIYPENYTRQISLADMALHFHMNPVYFCQYFKEKKGNYLCAVPEPGEDGGSKRLLQKGNCLWSRLPEW